MSAENIDAIKHAFLRPDGVLAIDFWYPPRAGDPPKPGAVFEIGLMDVRAADAIRVSYDFERDGYVIQQASIVEWDADDTVQDEDWQEVAFIPAWGRRPETAGGEHG